MQNNVTIEERRRLGLGVISPRWLEVVNLAEIRFQEGETIENALRRFKRKVLQEEIINRKKSRRDFTAEPNGSSSGSINS